MKLSQILRYASGVILLATFMFVGCVDVDNPNVSTVDLRTLTKFVYLNTQPDNLRVIIDGIPVAQLTQGEETVYLDLPAGKRQMTFVYASGTKVDTVSAQTLPQDRKINFFCIYDPSVGITTLQRHVVDIHTTYNGAVQYIPDKVLVRFLNFASDTAKIQLFTNGSLKRASTLLMSKMTSYDTVSIGPKFRILSKTNSVLVDSTLVSMSDGRYSVVLYGNGGSYKVIKED
ncbi:MAG: hypothetical protein N3A63_09575 [Bacteroidetes bacterium]|nr:hypothetical protein [Bacteroidota bacterium]